MFNPKGRFKLLDMLLKTILFLLEICKEHNQFLRLKFSHWLLKKEESYNPTAKARKMNDLSHLPMADKKSSVTPNVWLVAGMGEE